MKHFQHVSIIFLLILSLNSSLMAQKENQMVRLAKIKVDPAQLDQYNAALQEQMKTAIRVEPGVLTYYAVADKADPSSITILEIYASKEAYELHIATPLSKEYGDSVGKAPKHKRYWQCIPKRATRKEH